MAKPNPITDVVEVPSVGLAVEVSAEAAGAALDLYLAIQQKFDEKMPDAIMTLGRKKFRKKPYWRAISTAFHLTTELLYTKRIEVGHPGDLDHDWGYEASVRATDPNGRHSDGDGACMASEKVVYRWIDDKRTDLVDVFKTKQNASVHNIRAHAVTRAKNRAISDHSGFGEVSADELPSGGGGSSEGRDVPHSPTPTDAGGPPGGSSDRVATEKQLKLLGARAAAKAADLWDEIVAEGIASTFLNKGQIKGRVSELAREHVAISSEDEILAKQIDPLLEAILGAHVNPNGTVSIDKAG